MASAHKASPSTPSGGSRPKKSSTTTTTKSLIVRLKLSSTHLSKFLPAVTEPIKTESQAADDTKPASSSTSSLSDSKAPTASPLAEGEASNGNTPVPSGTDDSVAMPPPAEGTGAGKVGGKGKKRASLLVDGVVKPRGKPGPKKRKLDDGTADSPSSKPPHPSAAHKLGPKANQGAINAGLRALDRTGAPCRKWARGGFAIKSFTGTTWEIPRWRAPPKVSVTGVNGKEGGEGNGEGSSGKENKDSSQVESEKSNAGRDVEMSSPGVQASSPAPAMVAVA